MCICVSRVSSLLPAVLPHQSSEKIPFKTLMWNQNLKRNFSHFITAFFKRTQNLFFTKISQKHQEKKNSKLLKRVILFQKVMAFPLPQNDKHYHFIRPTIARGSNLHISSGLVHFRTPFDVIREMKGVGSSFEGRPL